jgi:spore coat polysaccharide biosynthesis protein SpsF
MTVGVIIQARTGSSRYPRKIYEDICGKYTLQRVLGGVTDAAIPNKIILAMPHYDYDEFDERRYGNGDFNLYTDDRFSTYFGDPDDLVHRYFMAARLNDLSLVVRVTGDCPLMQGWVIDDMITYYLKNGLNAYLANNRIVSKVPYPNGIDVEIFPYWMLAETHRLAKSAHDREHVCPFMYNGANGYDVVQFLNASPNTTISMKHDDISFDTKEDYELICKIAKVYDECGDISKAIGAV